MGTLRLILAMSVVAGHAGGRLFGVKLYGLSESVDVFFIISGFYMALILNEKYVAPGATRLFYAGRFLRLYPAYVIGIALAVAVNLSLSGGLWGTNAPSGGALAYAVVTNAAILGQDLPYVLCVSGADGTCLKPERLNLLLPAWSIAVEIVFYLIAPAIVRSTARCVLLWAAGLAYLALLGAAFQPGWPQPPLRTDIGLSNLQFYFFPGSWMFFGLGAIAYRVARLVREARFLIAAGIAVAVVAITILVDPRFDGGLVSWPEALVFAALIPPLFLWTGSNRYDRFIGELSYPVYILHYPLMIALRHAFGDGPAFASLLVCVTVALAIAVHLLVERPVEGLRAAIGARAKSAAAAC